MNVKKQSLCRASIRPRRDASKIRIVSYTCECGSRNDNNDKYYFILDLPGSQNISLLILNFWENQHHEEIKNRDEILSSIKSNWRFL